MVEYLLELSEIGSGRMMLEWVSASEAKRFAQVVERFHEQIARQGPFEVQKHALELSACRHALDTPRLRWLMGMEIQLTEKENVFHQTVDKTRYIHLLNEAARAEYENALITESLEEGPMSVREMAFKTGLSVYGVSSRLLELERRHRAELRDYDGSIPRFAASNVETEAAN